MASSGMGLTAASLLGGADAGATPPPPTIPSLSFSGNRLSFSTLPSDLGGILFIQDGNNPNLYIPTYGAGV